MTEGAPRSPAAGRAAIAECSRCRYRGRVDETLPAETMLRCDRCGARGRFLLVNAERARRRLPAAIRGR
jgi:hypothetical protein